MASKKRGFQCSLKHGSDLKTIVGQKREEGMAEIIEENHIVSMWEP